jgi:hypothetical protein
MGEIFCNYLQTYSVILLAIILPRAWLRHGGGFLWNAFFHPGSCQQF